jgi:hypothetical protein
MPLTTMHRLLEALATGEGWEVELSAWVERERAIGAIVGPVGSDGGSLLDHAVGRGRGGRRREHAA